MRSFAIAEFRALWSAQVLLPSPGDQFASGGHRLLSTAEPFPSSPRWPTRSPICRPIAAARCFPRSADLFRAAGDDRCDLVPGRNGRLMAIPACPLPAVRSAVRYRLPGCRSHRRGPRSCGRAAWATLRARSAKQHAPPASQPDPRFGAVAAVVVGRPTRTRLPGGIDSRDVRLSPSSS